jgi:molecular chaperone DnaK (HSP70)
MKDTPMAVTAKNSPYIVGIDLGTSNSAAAIFLKGRGEIVPIDGKPLLPSVVSIRESGDVLVGYPAKNLLLVDPENTVASIKREMGNAEWSKQFKGAPDKKYSPADISAEILTKIRVGIEQSADLDLRGSLRFAVICIPANFDDAKKRATLEAARLAGLEPLWLLEEPVAAAIAYALQAKRDQKILVYDLGGGTFDVSILNVDSTGDQRSQFRVLAKEGIPLLGGDDFDRALMQIVASGLKETTGFDIFDEKKDQGVSRKTLRLAQQKLKAAAEAAKVELSEADSTRIEIPNFLKDETGAVHNVDREVTRAEFEEAIRPMVAQTKEVMERALAGAKVTIDDISRIILVGGSTRVPLVKTSITEMFGKEPFGDLDPATAVARGAAIFGAALGVPTDKVEETADARPEDKPRVDISVNNIVTHHLGIEIAGGRFNKLLEKGVEIPVVESLIAENEYINPRDNMQEMRIAVYQASTEPDHVRDEGCQCIGEFFLTGIPPRPRGQARIKVKFEINQQNLLRVTALSLDNNGSTSSLDIDRRT